MKTRTWTRKGKPVKDTGKGATVAEINRRTAERIDAHVRNAGKSTFQRLLEMVIRDGNYEDKKAGNK